MSSIKSGLHTSGHIAVFFDRDQLCPACIMNDDSNDEAAKLFLDSSEEEDWLGCHAIEAVPAHLQLTCLLYTSPSPRDATLSRMPSSA